MTTAGIQVSSLKAYLRTPEEVRSTFARLSAMGCRMVQLQWIDFSVSPQCIAQALRETGLYSVSTQDYYDVVMERMDYFLQLNDLCGSTHICVSGIPERYRSAEGCAAYARELTALSRRLQAQGKVLSFHPRSQEYDRFDGTPGVQLLMEQTPEEVCLGLDLYHVRKAGLDPAQWIRDCKGRIDFVHFKDSLPLPDGGQQLMPVGQGDTDWAPVVRACLETEVPWAFAEQERWQKDAFVCMAESFDWMLQQGFRP